MHSSTNRMRMYSEIISATIKEIRLVSEWIQKFSSSIGPSFIFLYFQKVRYYTSRLKKGIIRQPTISHIKEIINQSKQSKLLGIFVGPQFNRSAIETISRELKRKYYVLDPLGVDAKSITDLFNKAYKVFTG